MPLDITDAKDRIIRRGPRKFAAQIVGDSWRRCTGLDRLTSDAAYFNRIPLAAAA